MDRLKFIYFTMIVHLYCGVNSLDSNNSMLGTLNSNTPVMLQSNISNTGNADTVALGENDLEQVIKMCNESYQIPISKFRCIFIPLLLVHEFYCQYNLVNHVEFCCIIAFP